MQRASGEYSFKPVIQLSPYYPAYFVIGKKGAGKSALLEKMLQVYYDEGYQVMDWNCAADFESFQWSVKDPDKPDSREFPILIIHPAATEITITPRKITLPDGREVEAVKTILDSTSLRDIILEAQREKRIIIFSIYLYENEVKGQHRFAQLIKMFPKIVRDYFPKNMKFAIGLRELADLSSNRMLTFAGTGERETKRTLNHFSRLARHSRTVLVLDMQDPEQVYSALVSQEDFILVKRLNRHHIPQKLNWLNEDVRRQIDFARQHYLFTKLRVVSLDRIANNSFVCVWPSGDYSYEHNSEPSFKHHDSNDDAQELSGVRVKFLAKDELEGTDEAKIEAIKERREVTIQKEKALVEAIRLHEEEGMSWDAVAAKVGWLVNGLPSGPAVKMAARRYQERQHKQGQDSGSG